MLTFILLMFQRRFFESRHFSRLAENAKITAVLASKMYITVQEWGRKRKDENRLLDSKSIMKIKEKVNKLRKNKERITKKKETHFTGTKSVFIIIHLLSTLHLYTQVYNLLAVSVKASPFFFYKLHRKIKSYMYTYKLFFG